MKTEEITKSLPVTKPMVWEAYKQVKRNGGSAGVDKESIEKFDADLSKNLYKIWNHLTSGVKLFLLISAVNWILTPAW